MTKRLPPALAAVMHGVESERERELLVRCERAGLPEPETQYRIIPTRRFRWDAAWPSYRVCVEVQGGQFVRGGHQRPLIYERDQEKAALAQLMGWLSFAVTPRQVASGQAVEWITAALVGRGWVST